MELLPHPSLRILTIGGRVVAETALHDDIATMQTIPVADDACGTSCGPYEWHVLQSFDCKLILVTL